MRIDPVLLISLLIFCGLLIALLLASSGKNKKSAAVKRLQALSPVMNAKLEGDTDTPQRREALLALLPDSVQQKMRRALVATGDKLSFEGLLLVAAGIGAAIGLLCSVVIGLSMTISVAAALVSMVVLPWFVLRSMKAKHVANFLRLFPDAIDLIVRAVRAGLPVSIALEAAGRETPDPVGVEFRHVIADMRIGLDLDEALARAAARIRLVDFDFFVASLVLQRKSGGNLSETLAVLSSVLRRREELRSKTKAMTSEARASAVVLAALPFFAGGGILLINPGYFSILMTDPRGAYVLGGGLLSLLFGMLSMRVLIQKALA
ncbi:MAG TPA: type II secretion system F family protein [Aliidongia sp.]|uniref:type II secretion system F family protein n=1 Tax=Aliidongia sp. TaxID=1914230 RepID=UPI002DDD75AB|nr:type II secretion system F family protein [Aliidongia sp.]HEV2676364.1 type II secretion system F family protein [Aliidongia sp.]